MDLNLSTSRAPNGDITTTTPGVSAFGGDLGDFSKILGTILQNRLQQAQAPAMSQMATRGSAREQTPAYAPTLGAGIRKPLAQTRLVQVRQPANAWAGGSALDSITYQMVPSGVDMEATDFRRNQSPVRVDYGGQRQALSASDDPRMRALVADQSAARRGLL